MNVTIPALAALTLTEIETASLDKIQDFEEREQAESALLYKKRVAIFERKVELMRAKFAKEAAENMALLRHQTRTWIPDIQLPECYGGAVVAKDPLAELRAERDALKAQVAALTTPTVQAAPPRSYRRASFCRSPQLGYNAFKV